MKVTTKITVSGDVQGVGFRWFIIDTASRLKLQGYVRNLRTGDVEIEAEGEKSDIESLIEAAGRGPGFSNVTSVRVKWHDYENKFASFKIGY